MNRRKRHSNLGLPSLLMLLVAAVIVAVGGIGYVITKNQQVTARRQIQKIEQKIEEHKDSITLQEVHISEVLGIKDLPQTLEASNSNLRSIPEGVVKPCLSESPEGQTPERTSPAVADSRPVN